MDGREEAGAEVVVQVLVLAHLKDLLPLLHGHLVLDAFSSLLLVTDLLPAKLQKHKVKSGWRKTQFPRNHMDALESKDTDMEKKQDFYLKAGNMKITVISL